MSDWLRPSLIKAVTVLLIAFLFVVRAEEAFTAEV